MDKQARPSKKRNERRKLFGLPLIIEYHAGDLRGGTSADGKAWVRKLHCAYGEIAKTEGMDGDALDVYIGPALDSEKVFAITQMKAPAFKVVDEQKFMLGFKTMAKARATYLAHYPDDRILGSIVEMPLAKFQEKAMDPKLEGKKLASLRRFIEINLHREAAGEEKLAAARVMGGPGAAAVAAQFSAERGVASPFTPDLGGNAFNYRDYPRQPVSQGPAVLHVPGRNIKVGSAALKFAALNERASRIADRIDDAGLALLAAPYAAAGAAKHLHGKAGVLGAVGSAAAKAEHFLHRKIPNRAEILGLAAVAPGVTHPVAKAIDKATTKKSALSTAAVRRFTSHETGKDKTLLRTVKKVEAHVKDDLQDWKKLDAGKKVAFHKFAASFYQDFEDLTEPEKDRVAAEFAKLAAGPAMTVSKLRSAGKSSLEHLRSLKGQTPLNRELNAASTGFRMQRGVTPPPAAQPSLFRAGNIARAAGVGAVGLGLYGGAKAINAGASLAQNERHYQPAARPDFTTGAA